MVSVVACETVSISINEVRISGTSMVYLSRLDCRIYRSFILINNNHLRRRVDGLDMHLHRYNVRGYAFVRIK